MSHVTRIKSVNVVFHHDPGADTLQPRFLVWHHNANHFRRVFQIRYSYERPKGTLRTVTTSLETQEKIKQSGFIFLIFKCRIIVYLR